MLFYIIKKLLSFNRFHANKLVRDFRDMPVQTAKQRNIRTPFFADRVIYQFRQFAVAKHEPPALRNAVGFILELFGIISIRRSEKVVFQNFGMQFCYAVNCFPYIYRKICH